MVGVWVGVMDSGSLEWCQKLHCKIWCCCHLSGCRLRIPRECIIVQVCSVVHFSYGIARPA